MAWGPIKNLTSNQENSNLDTLLNTFQFETSTLVFSEPSFAEDKFLSVTIMHNLEILDMFSVVPWSDFAY